MLVHVLTLPPKGVNHPGYHFLARDVVVDDEDFDVDGEDDGDDGDGYGDDGDDDGDDGDGKAHMLIPSKTP